MKYLWEGIHNYGKLTVISKLSKGQYERKEDYYLLACVSKFEPVDFICPSMAINVT